MAPDDVMPQLFKVDLLTCWLSFVGPFLIRVQNKQMKLTSIVQVLWASEMLLGTSLASSFSLRATDIESEC